jgi:hypothetical protein
MCRENPTWGAPRIHGELIAWNEPHLKRLLAEYVRYYHADRTHLGLAKQTPGNRKPSTGTGRMLVLSRLGGLHHRYERAA